MKINCFTDYTSVKGYVMKYPINEYPEELEGEYKYVFPFKIYKTEFDSRKKIINKGVYLNVYCFSESTAEIGRILKEGDFISIDGDFENLYYDHDGKRYKANVFRACRISILKTPNDLEKED